MPEVQGPERLELSSSDTAAIPARGEPQTFYRYEGKGGKVVIVDSLSKLPPEAREHAERLDLGAAKPAPPKPEASSTQTAVDAPLDAAPSLPALGRGDNPPGSHAAGSTEQIPSKRGAFDLDGASFGLGLGAGLLLALALVFIAGRSEAGGMLQRWIVRSALFVGVVLLGSSAYLGWSRRHAGLGGAALASPQDLIRDAKGAVDQTQQRRLEQEKQLEEIKRLAR